MTSQSKPGCSLHFIFFLFSLNLIYFYILMAVCSFLFSQSHSHRPLPHTTFYFYSEREVISIATFPGLSSRSRTRCISYCGQTRQPSYGKGIGREASESTPAPILRGLTFHFIFYWTIMPKSKKKDKMRRKSALTIG